MQRATLILTITFALLLIVFVASPSFGVPILGKYQEDPRCDTIANQSLRDEIGDAAIFPINESIIYQAAPTQTTVCVANDGQQNDWLVRMQNTSGVAWTNLFFVVDAGGSFGN